MVVEKAEEKSESFGSQLEPTTEMLQKMTLGRLSTIDQEKIIKEGVVRKKTGWIFYSDRKLVLTSRPRLSYYVPSSGEYKVNNGGNL